MSTAEENVPNKWEELHAGLITWEDLVNPLQPWLREEITKYGDFAQATYDAFNHNHAPDTYGECMYEKDRLFQELHLTKHRYEVTKYIHAMSPVRLLHHLKASQISASWGKDSHWMGFVAVNTDEESERIGRRDIVMAWRGTVAATEWFSNFEAILERIGNGDAMVGHGFHKIYKSKCESTVNNKLSASEQVMEAVKELVTTYREKGEKVSFTITGHSLGGALALLNAFEAATLLPELPITVISFGAPYVGNAVFREKIDEMKVKTLRIIVGEDIVPIVPPGDHLLIKLIPTLPGKRMLINVLRRMLSNSPIWEFMYAHVGKELTLRMASSPYLKPKFIGKDCHNLEIYLHLVHGFHSKDSSFRECGRDIALVNKRTGMLLKKLEIPKKWYKKRNKGGLVFNSTSGKWDKPSRQN